MKFIGNPKYSEGNLHASADEGKGGWPSVVLKAAYKKCPAPSAQEYKDLAMEAYGNHTDANIADVKRFFRERRLQEFAKKEAALKRKVLPPCSRNGNQCGEIRPELCCQEFGGWKDDESQPQILARPSGVFG